MKNLILDQLSTFNSQPSTALFISPHLDDVAFSCGGTLIKLADANWQTVLCTIFTKSAANPQGFALACQMDKGLAPEADYMQLRRIEDADFARIANVSDLIHFDFPEAPHRGYSSAPELFAGARETDEIWRDVAAKLKQLVEEFEPSVVFAPQGIGNHVDHLQTIRAVLANHFDAQTFWYEDTPYVIRHPGAPPCDLLSSTLKNEAVEITGTIERKIDGCCAYKTQIGFQFGGAEKLAQILKQFHSKQPQNPDSKFVENFAL